MRPIREVRQACLAAQRILDEIEVELIMSGDVVSQKSMRRQQVARAALETLNWVLEIEQNCEVMTGRLHILGDVPGDKEPTQ